MQSKNGIELHLGALVLLAGKRYWDLTVVTYLNEEGHAREVSFTKLCSRDLSKKRLIAWNRGAHQPRMIAEAYSSHFLMAELTQQERQDYERILTLMRKRGLFG